MTAWLVKYDGVCARCATPLLRGSPAVWDRASRTMRCIECPAIPDVAPPPPVDVGEAGASARREYERRVAKRDAVIEQRWGRPFGRVVENPELTDAQVERITSVLAVALPSK